MSIKCADAIDIHRHSHLIHMTLTFDLFELTLNQLQTRVTQDYLVYQIY